MGRLVHVRPLRGRRLGRRAGAIPGPAALRADRRRGVPRLLPSHETQHLADRRTFPGLDAWQLEYRAKLTEELALARSTRKDLLESFGANQGDDPGVPHPYANRRVLADLRAQLGSSAGADLGTVPEGALQAAARAVLRADTQQRQETPRGTPPTP